MPRKCSSIVSLVLVSSVLASCNQLTSENKKQTVVNNNKDVQKVYMRADSSAPYTDVTQQYNPDHQTRRSGMGLSPILWYMAFRSMGSGMGYQSNNLAPRSNYGNNVAKSNAFKSANASKASRGGFGSSSKSSRVSS